MNILGQEVLNMELQNKNNVNLNLSAFDNGLYTLIVRKDNRSSVARVQLIK